LTCYPFVIFVGKFSNSFDKICMHHVAAMKGGRAKHLLDALANDDVGVALQFVPDRGPTQTQEKGAPASRAPLKI